MNILKPKRTRGDVGNAMTDISFLLIIFFLVATVFVSDEGLALLLPEKNILPERKTSKDVVQITLTSDELKLEDETISDDMLKATLEPRVAANPDLIAIIAVEDGISYGRVVDILSRVRSAGIESFTLQDGNNKDFLIPVKIGSSEGAE